MEALGHTFDRSPIFFEGADTGVEPTFQTSKEPLFATDLKLNYYKGITALANFIYDICIRILQYFICVCKRPWPEWSWSTNVITRNDVITLRDDSAAHLEHNDFFKNVLEAAILPLHAKSGSLTPLMLEQDFVSSDKKSCSALVLRRTYYNGLVCKIGIHRMTGSKQIDLISEYTRSTEEIRERQRGVYVSNHIKQEDSLIVSYSDRAAFKHQVVAHGLKLCGINLVSGASGHPDQELLTFLEDSLFHKPKNGCTFVYFNPKSQDLEFTCTIDQTEFPKLEESVLAFNEKQVQPRGEKFIGCRAEFTKLTVDNPDIRKVMLTIKKSAL